jgi:ATP-dependent Lon protease
MKDFFVNSDPEDWDDSEDEDEILFESEEFSAQIAPEPNETESIISDDLPVLPLRGVVVYPMMWLPLPIGQERSIRLVENALPNNRIIALVTSKDEQVEEPSPGDIRDVGTAAQIHRVLKTPDGSMRLLVQGLERVRIREYVQEQPYLRARIEIMPEILDDDIEMEAVMRAVQQLFRRLVELEPQMPDELAVMSINVDDGRQLAYLVASSMRLKVDDAQALLEMDSVRSKLYRITELLKKEVEVLEMSRKIQTEAQGEMEKMQREYYLREQMKAIQKELGEEDEQAADLRELEERISAAGLTEEAEKEARRELGRMRRMPIQAGEYSVIKTYLDLMVSLPWQQSTPDNLDIDHARQVLDEDHFGLHEIKERILEFLAVRKLRAERKAEGQEDDLRDKIRREREGVVLCFVGPPRRRQNQPGHQHRPCHRTANSSAWRWVGCATRPTSAASAAPTSARCPVASSRACAAWRASNPVFMLDEVDKLGTRLPRRSQQRRCWRCSTRNRIATFTRSLSRCGVRPVARSVFITTANILDTVPPALRDRMEIIELNSYTHEDEKVQIAQALPDPAPGRKRHGLRADAGNSCTDAAVHEIIQRIHARQVCATWSATLAKLCRKIAAKVAAGLSGDIAIDVGGVIPYLGKYSVHPEDITERTQLPGVAIGLAWTAVGGDVMFFEATRAPGAKGFTLTGQLGDVMKESAQAALSFVRNRAEKLGVDPDFFATSDIHLHIPAGATPKDGPSAGITMATALASLLTGRLVRPNLGMTGEITLRGKVLPIGGVKEKMLAAARFGLTTVILPKRNEADLDDVPEAVRDGMKFILADTMDEVLEHALCPAIGDNQ